MDVEKALPRKIRKRLVPERQVIRPNQYTGFARYWYSQPITSQDIQTALKPNKVGFVYVFFAVTSTIRGEFSLESLGIQFYFATTPPFVSFLTVGRFVVVVVVVVLVLSLLSKNGGGNVPTFWYFSLSNCLLD